MFGTRQHLRLGIRTDFGNLLLCRLGRRTAAPDALWSADFGDADEGISTRSRFCEQSLVVGHARRSRHGLRQMSVRDSARRCCWRSIQGVRMSALASEAVMRSGRLAQIAGVVSGKACPQGIRVGSWDCLLAKGSARMRLRCVGKAPVPCEGASPRETHDVRKAFEILQWRRSGKRHGVLRCTPPVDGVDVGVACNACELQSHESHCCTPAKNDREARRESQVEIGTPGHT